LVLVACFFCANYERQFNVKVQLERGIRRKIVASPRQPGANTWRPIQVGLAMLLQPSDRRSELYKKQHHFRKKKNKHSAVTVKESPFLHHTAVRFKNTRTVLRSEGFFEL